MPTVPRRDSGPIQQSALPNVNLRSQAPAEAFGLGQASISKPVSTLVDIIDREKRNADEVAVTEAASKLSERKNELIYNPETGAMTRKGKNAFGISDEFGSAFDRDADEIEKSLNSNEQRAAFARYRNRERNDLSASLNRHIYSESKAYDTQVTESGLKTAKNEALLNYADPNKIQESIDKQRDLIIAHAQRNGMDEAWAKQKFDEQSSSTHTDIVKRMLANGNDLQAQSYYNKNKAFLTGEDAKNIEGALETGSVRGTSQRTSDALWDKSGGNLTTALEQAREIKDPKVREATEQRLRQRASDTRAAKEYDTAQVFESASEFVEQQKSIDAVPPELWNALPTQKKHALEERVKQLRAGVQPQTDWDEYYYLENLAKQKPDSFGKIDLREYRSKLGDTEFKEMVKLQGSVTKGDNTLLDGIRSKSEIIGSSLAEAGFDPNPKPGSEDASKVNRFKSMVDREVMLRQKQTGKKVTNDEVKSIVDNLMVEGVTEKGLIWDTKKRVFEVDQADPFEVNASAVPKSERAAIEDALKKRGLPASDEMVSRMYNAKVKRTLSRGN